jgi:hypothetical protein
MNLMLADHIPVNAHALWQRVLPSQAWSAPMLVDRTRRKMHESGNGWCQQHGFSVQR